MKIIIISLTIAVLLGSSEAGPTTAESYLEFDESSASNVIAPPGTIEITMPEVADGIFRITCKVTGDQLSYNWTAEGGLLSNEEQYRDHIEIYNFEKANDRTFCCIAYNEAGQVQKCKRVSRFARISAPREEISVGDSVEVNCRVFGSEASKIHLQWRRPADQEFSKNAIIKDGALKIHNVTVTDSGSYDCVGLDDHGNELFRRDYRLALEGSPMIRFSGDRSHFVVGGSFSVSCEVYSGEPMTVELKPEDGVLLPNETIEGLVIEVHDIPENFDRTYKCTASNQFGTASERTHWSLQGED